MEYSTLYFTAGRSKFLVANFSVAKDVMWFLYREEKKQDLSSTPKLSREQLKENGAYRGKKVGGASSHLCGSDLNWSQPLAKGGRI